MLDHQSVVKLLCGEVVSPGGFGGEQLHCWVGIFACVRFGELVRDVSDTGSCAGGADPIAGWDIRECGGQTVGMPASTTHIAKKHDVFVVGEAADFTWEVSCWSCQFRVDSVIDVREVAWSQVFDMICDCASTPTLEDNRARWFDTVNLEDERLRSDLQSAGEVGSAGVHEVAGLELGQSGQVRTRACLSVA